MESLAFAALVAWIAVVLLSMSFHFRWDAARKRRYWPFMMIANVALFALFLALVAPPAARIIAIPALLLILVGNLRAMRFCDACNASAYSRNAFVPPAFCSKCGSPLKPGPGLRNLFSASK